MSKTKLLFLTFVISTLQCCQPDLECKDFKQGTFYIDSENGGRTIVIVRHGDSQVEYANSIGSDDKKKVLLEWIDDCSYHLMFDETQTNLSEDEKWLNENRGVRVSKLEINGRCMNYEAKVITQKGKEIIQRSTICKK